jgi:hypothetical protein
MGGHVKCIAYKHLVRKCREYILKSSRYRRENDCREIMLENVDWNHLAQNRNQWQDLINIVWYDIARHLPANTLTIPGLLLGRGYACNNRRNVERSVLYGVRAEVIYRELMSDWVSWAGESRPTEGSQSSRTVKYGHKSREIRNQESLCWRGPAAI